MQPCGRSSTCPPFANACILHVHYTQPGNRSIPRFKRLQRQASLKGEPKTFSDLWLMDARVTSATAAYGAVKRSNIKGNEFEGCWRLLKTGCHALQTSPSINFPQKLALLALPPGWACESRQVLPFLSPFPQDTMCGESMCFLFQQRNDNTHARFTSSH